MSARRRCLPRTQRRKSIPLPLRTFRPPPPLLRACRGTMVSAKVPAASSRQLRHRQKQRQPGLRILIIGRSLALRRSSSSSLDSTIPSPITPMHTRATAPITTRRMFPSIASSRGYPLRSRAPQRERLRSCRSVREIESSMYLRPM